MVYVTVRYGENKEEIFNPYCKIYLLLKTIRQKCNCGREVDIDVSDESGNIKNLRDPHIQLRYANEVLEEREKLVLLKVERKHPDSHQFSYTPLLQDDAAILTEEFLARLALKDPGARLDGRHIKSSRRNKESTKLSESMKSNHGREKGNDKLKSTKADKRASAKSRR